MPGAESEAEPGTNIMATTQQEAKSEESDPKFNIPFQPVGGRLDVNRIYKWSEACAIRDTFIKMVIAHSGDPKSWFSAYEIQKKSWSNDNITVLDREQLLSMHFESYEQVIGFMERLFKAMGYEILRRDTFDLIKTVPPEYLLVDADYMTSLLVSEYEWETALKFYQPGGQDHGPSIYKVMEDAMFTPQPQARLLPVVTQETLEASQNDSLMNTVEASVSKPKLPVDFVNVVATKRAMNEAAANGHEDSVAWLHFNRTEGCTGDAIDNAPSRGHYQVVRWLAKHRNEGFTSLAVLGAAVNGHLPLLKLLYRLQPNLPVPASTFDQVCANGHIHVARFLTSRNLGGGSANAMNWAAANGHLELLKWLALHRVEGCTIAAMDGAATNGRVRVLEWLQARGENCSTAAMDGAARNGYLRALKWFAAHRTEGCTSLAFQAAARSGNKQIVTWLYANARSMYTSPAIDHAVQSGNSTLVEWFIRVRGETCSRRGMIAAVDAGHIKVLELMRSMNGTEGCDAVAFDIAIERQDFYLVRWIATNFPQVVSREWLLVGGARNGWTEKLVKLVLDF